MGSDKFWNCFVEDTNGGYHYKHATLESAKQEAERLARMPGNKGRRVFVTECLCYCEVPETPVEWHEIE
jgi:hypothetical protein